VLDRQFSAEVCDELLKWSQVNGRQLPWRKTADPYRVFVAEFMLQRTGVSQVANVYDVFLARFPNAHTVRNSPIDEIASALGPLGLRKRIPQFHEALSLISSVYGGRVPETLSDLLALPGVGPYTARAVLCFAYGHRVGIVDVNITRVLERLLGESLSSGSTHARKRTWDLADALVSFGCPKAVNWALLDLAHLVCVRGEPCCSTCPLARLCAHSQPAQNRVHPRTNSEKKPRSGRSGKPTTRPRSNSRLNSSQLVSGNRQHA
jgi:A/G-specific adenine glycosylase